MANAEPSRNTIRNELENIHSGTTEALTICSELLGVDSSLIATAQDGVPCDVPSGVLPDIEASLDLLTDKITELLVLLEKIADKL